MYTLSSRAQKMIQVQIQKVPCIIIIVYKIIFILSENYIKYVVHIKIEIRRN